MSSLPDPNEHPSEPVTQQTSYESNQYSYNDWPEEEQLETHAQDTDGVAAEDQIIEEYADEGAPETFLGEEPEADPFEANGGFETYDAEVDLPQSVDSGAGVNLTPLISAEERLRHAASEKADLVAEPGVIHSANAEEIDDSQLWECPDVPEEFDVENAPARNLARTGYFDSPEEPTAPKKAPMPVRGPPRAAVKLSTLARKSVAGPPPAAKGVSVEKSPQRPSVFDDDRELMSSKKVEAKDTSTAQRIGKAGTEATEGMVKQRRDARTGTETRARDDMLNRAGSSGSQTMGGLFSNSLDRDLS